MNDALAKALQIRGAPNELELEYLYRNSENKEVVEVGCDFGRSSLVIASSARRFTTVDNFSFYANSAKPKFIENMQDLDYVLMEMDSTAAAKIYKGKPDFIFIDGDHTAKGVNLDIKAWLPLLRVGGEIAFHDCDNTFPDYVAKITELLGQPKAIVDRIYIYEKGPK